jgi:hypothetical protein
MPLEILAGDDFMQVQSVVERAQAANDNDRVGFDGIRIGWEAVGTAEKRSAVIDAA